MVKRKCSCGCKETNWRIDLFGWFIWYFTDANNWWIRLGSPWKTLSYSPCQGFMLFDNKLFQKERK